MVVETCASRGFRGLNEWADARPDVHRAYYLSGANADGGRFACAVASVSLSKIDAGEFLSLHLYSAATEEAALLPVEFDEGAIRSRAAVRCPGVRRRAPEEIPKRGPEPVEPKPEIVKKKPCFFQLQSKPKTEIVENESPKEEKKTKVKRDSPPEKRKRQRIVRLESDSESESEAETHFEPRVDEDVIPPTPPPAVARPSTKKTKKDVVYRDEDGYLRTVKTDETVVEEPEPETKSTSPPKIVVPDKPKDPAPDKPKTSPPTKKSKKAAAAATRSKQQPNIMSFFKKAN